MDPLKPPATVLIKLGSIMVHAEEHLETFRVNPPAALFDEEAIKSSLTDPEIIEWREAMTKMAFMPVKRSERG